MSKNKKLSDGNKVRDKSTLDWDEIRRKNLERLDDEISRGVDDPMTRRRLQDRERAAQGLAPIVTPTAPKRSTPQQIDTGARKDPGRRLRTDQVADIIEKYREGYSPNDIAEMIGTTNTTVIERLKRAGIYEPNKFRYRDTTAATKARWSETAQPKGEYL